MPIPFCSLQRLERLALATHQFSGVSSNQKLLQLGQNLLSQALTRGSIMSTLTTMSAQWFSLGSPFANGFFHWHFASMFDALHWIRMPQVLGKKLEGKKWQRCRQQFQKSKNTWQHQPHCQGSQLIAHAVKTNATIYVISYKYDASKGVCRGCVASSHER